MRTFIEKSVNTVLKEYENRPQRITSDYNIEDKSKKSYQGREILELIQNADDEMSKLPINDRIIKISYHDNLLSVYNNGLPFSKEGVESLMLAYNSDKTKRKQKTPIIGSFGIGFRAILSWTDIIEIHSEKLHIQFSSDYSQEMLRRLSPSIVKDRKAATLAFPKWIENANLGEYTTEIRLQIKDNKRVKREIMKQINDIDETILLFLNYTCSIIVETDDHCFEYRKEKTSEGVKVEKIIDGQREENEVWILLEEKGRYDNQSYSIMVAYPKNGTKPPKQKLFCYLPTSVPLQLPLLLHATFELTSNRKHLIENSLANEFLLGKAADLIIKAAVLRTHYESEASFNSLKMIIPTSDIEFSDLHSYSFWETLFERSLQAKLLPTVNNEYIAGCDKPKSYDGPIARFLHGSQFKELLKYTDDLDILEFINSSPYEMSIYSHGDFDKFINQWAKARVYSEENVIENCLLIRAILDEQYVHYINPTLIYCNDKFLASEKSKALVYSGDYSVKIPGFIRARTIDSFMLKALEVVFDEDIDNLMEKLAAFNLKPFAFEEIAEKMSRTIERHFKQKDYDKSLKCIDEAIRWLWDNFDDLLDSELDSFDMYLLSRKGKIVKSSMLYTGKEYENYILENLYFGFSKDVFVADYSTVVNSNDTSKLVAMLEKLGVSNKPRRIEMDIESSKRSLDLFISNFVWNNIDLPYRCNNNELDINDWHAANCVSISTYENLEWILKNSSTEAILDWIRNDEELMDNLKTRKDQNSEIEVIFGKLKTYHMLPPENTPSYVAWRFNTVSWIVISNKRHKMKDCVLEDIPIGLSDVLVCPDYSNYIVRRLENKEGSIVSLTNQCKAILSSIGVRNTFGDLPSRKLYDFLDKLHEVSIENQYVRQAYKKVYESVDINDFSSDGRDRFIKKGKVLCKDGLFYDTNKCFYMGKRLFCRAVMEKLNFIDMKKDLDPAKVSMIFGVEETNVMGQLLGMPIVHPANAKFQKNFEHYKQCAYCYRYGKNITNAEKEKTILSDLKIVICSSIKASFNGEEIRFCDYDFITENGKLYYLMLPIACEEENDFMNYDTGDAISGILCEVLDLSEERNFFRDLYIKNKTDRVRAIYDETDDRTIFDVAKLDLAEKDKVRDEFVSILSQDAGASDELISEYSHILDMDDLNSKKNVRFIIELFKKCNYDVTQYNSKSKLTYFDLTEYYADEIETFKHRFRDLYRRYTFHSLLNGSLDEKVKLLDMWYYFEDLNVQIANSVTFDPEDELRKCVFIPDEAEDIDLVELHNSNKVKFETMISNNDYVDAFYNQSNEITSLMYFGEYEELVKRYLAFSTDNHQSGEILEINPRVLTEIKNVSTLPIDKNAKNTPKFNIKRVGFSESDLEKRNSQNKRDGYKGENVVYDWLKRKNLEVCWVSENAKKAGVNPAGSADYKYDISYRKDGKVFYVEVKATSSKTNEIVFYMSDNEYEFAKKHESNYRLFFVSDVRSNSPKIWIVDNLVVDGAFNEKAFQIEKSIQYTVRGTLDSTI